MNESERKQLAYCVSAGTQAQAFKAVLWNLAALPLTCVAVIVVTLSALTITDDMHWSLTALTIAIGHWACMTGPVPIIDAWALRRALKVYQK